MKKLVLFIFIMSFSFIANTTFALPNPAAVYCMQMGYQYKIIGASGGQVGQCIFPDGSQCEEWQFLEGKCGQSYSYCKKNGYDIKTMTDGNNPYSPDYAVCVPKIYGQKQISVTDILSIKSDITPNSISPSSTSSSASSLTSLPSSFDWRNNNGNWMTPVKDQGSCGSCWAFGAVGTVEAKLKIEKNTPNDNSINLSEQDLISCSGEGDCHGGGEVSALIYIMNTGIVNETCFPYKGVDANGNDYYGGGHTPVPCSNKICSTPLTKINGYSTPPAYDVSTIESTLIQKGPMLSTLYVSGYFDSKGIYKCDSIDENKIHAVVLVGYDDIGGYWIAKNSWGSTWNGDGYFKIYYGSCIFSPEVYVYATGQKNGVCSKDAGASTNCDGKLPSSSWCDSGVNKSCDSLCHYSEFCDSKCSSPPNCVGRAPSTAWCDGNTQKGCSASCQYSAVNCPVQTPIDTDGGDNPFVVGTCSYAGCRGSSCVAGVYTDHCFDSIVLFEYFISGSSCSIDHINCTRAYGSNYFCSNGACIPSGGRGCVGCRLLTIGPYLFNVDITPLISITSAILVIIEIVILMTIYSRLKHAKRKKR